MKNKDLTKFDKKYFPRLLEEWRQLVIFLVKLSKCQLKIKSGREIGHARRIFFEHLREKSAMAPPAVQNDK
jgi:hypothetical protein